MTILEFLREYEGRVVYEDKILVMYHDTLFSVYEITGGEEVFVDDAYNEKDAVKLLIGEQEK